MPLKKTTSSVESVYNTIGKEFSTTRAYIWPDLKPYLDKVKPDATVLDLGCGNGRLILGLPSDIKYQGLDISQVLLDEAKKKHPGRSFEKADITDRSTWTKLPKYDYIFCVAVIHHLASIKDQAFVLGQIKAHLKPNGKYLLTVWNLYQPRYLKYHLDLKTKLQNPHFVYIPFQGVRRFCFAHTKNSLRSLQKQARLQGQITKTKHNYLISNCI